MGNLNTQVSALIQNAIANAEGELESHLVAWPHKTEDTEVHEVVSGMMSRQFSLMTHLLSSPACWNWDVAPLFLRSMIEIILNLSWIVKEPKVRARAYIAYGLGQEKLRVEHMKANLETMDSTDCKGYAQAIEACEQWIAQQRYPFLVEVNVGTWAENQFKMAQETGELSLYHNCYGPFSGCVHSMWHHVARYNLQLCKNPLHRGHRVIKIGKSISDLHIVYLAAKYFHRTLLSVRRAFQFESEHESTFAMVRREISTLSAENDSKNYTPEEAE